MAIQKNMRCVVFNHRWPVAKKEKYADFIIYNNGTEEETEQQLKKSFGDFNKKTDLRCANAFKYAILIAYK